MTRADQLEADNADLKKQLVAEWGKYRKLLEVNLRYDKALKEANEKFHTDGGRIAELETACEDHTSDYLLSLERIAELEGYDRLKNEQITGCYNELKRKADRIEELEEIADLNNKTIDTHLATIDKLLRIAHASM